MDASDNLRVKYWFFALGFTGLIYSTLSIVRPICAYLREITPFPLMINALCGALLIFILAWIGFNIRITKRSSYVLLAAVPLAYVYGLMTIPYPEEKIHLVEYGILAYLIFKAVRIDVPGPACYVYSLLLVSVFGWIDEGIQYVLPNRYYANKDVILNIVSGALGLLLVFVVQREQT